MECPDCGTAHNDLRYVPLKAACFPELESALVQLGKGLEAMAQDPGLAATSAHAIAEDLYQELLLLLVPNGLIQH